MMEENKVMGLIFFLHTSCAIKHEWIGVPSRNRLRGDLATSTIMFKQPK